MQLYPHQPEAVQWLVDHARTGLFDEQGLGKTISAIVATNELKLKRVLVVAPLSVVHNWQSEIRAWGAWASAGIQVVTTSTAKIVPVNWVIISHGMLLKPAIVKQLRNFELIILDEAHAMRNASAIRSRVFYLGDALCRRAPRTWILTGTPVPNNPSELWTMLAGLDPERLRHEGKLLNSVQWRDRFCETVTRWRGKRRHEVVVGVKRLFLDELRTRIRGFALRRLKSDVLDLPPLRWCNVALTAERMPVAAVSTPSLRHSMHDSEEGLLDRVQKDASFAEWYHQCGLAKVEPACEILRNDLEAGMKKVVVGAHHRDVISQIASNLAEYGALEFTGSTNVRDRQRYIDLFKNDPNTRVLVCQLQAGGVGINLQTAQDMVFVEQSFSPGDNAQFVGRIERIGQTRPMLVRFFSLAGSIDEPLGKILARKTQMIKETLTP